ncbi:FAD/NAD-P-binding domain-containing protein [Daedaleopsis nitida]|nr:FAD/NAD-P-binding domain-containing protein [Daedaleopsis nitida]
MPIVYRTAPLTLDVVVIGGGLGGLAVAYMLSKAGHRVKVFEKGDLNTGGGGRRVPPNLSKILRQWVGEEELMKIATRCAGSPFYRLRTGERIGYLPWRPAVMEETGGDFLFMRHGDLVQLLYRLAIDAGTQVELHREVTAVNSAPAPSVTLATSGEVVTADLIIGADGRRSVMHDAIAPGEECVQPGNLIVFSGIVPAEDMLRDEQLSMLLVEDDWIMFVGDRKALCGHIMSSKKEFSFDLFVWKTVMDYAQENGCSNVVCSIDDISIEGLCSLAQKLVRLSTRLDCARYIQPISDGMHDWIDASGRMTLLGDAAHPTIPTTLHTASLAIEDAVVLGCIFSHIRTTDQIPTFLHAYEDLRQRRCNLITSADIRQLKMLTLPPGPEADARDRNVSRPPEEWNDELRMKAQFDDIAEVFVYDAGDAAEEWWINWGRLHEMARESPIAAFTTEGVPVPCA